MKKTHILFAIVAIILFGCEKPKKENNQVISDNSGVKNLYILNEGSWNQNNASLTKVDLTLGSVTNDYFRLQNQRGLGDVANDMQRYGGKIYVVVNNSNTVEVIDANNGNSLKSIPIVNTSQVGRSPRNIAFARGKAFVCSFDGTVVKIDTTTLSTEGFCSLSGTTPDGITSYNGKLYVSNSGSYPNFNNTSLSIVDITSFTEVENIKIGINIGQLVAGSNGLLYILSRGNYGSIPGNILVFNPQSNTVVDTLKSEPMSFCMNGNYLYWLSFNKSTKTTRIICYNIISKSTTTIFENNDFKTPYGISINPKNNDIYITDAENYTANGTIYSFGSNGVAKSKFNVGMLPSKMLFY